MKKLPPRFTPGNFVLSVQRTTTGRGLFTKTAIRKGACITEYTGRKISKKEAEERAGRYFFEVARGVTIDGNIPSNKARFINHSCRPNCEAVGPTGRVFIRAMRAIRAGEELTYDYGKEYFKDYLSNGRCRCVKCASR